MIAGVVQSMSAEIEVESTKIDHNGEQVPVLDIALHDGFHSTYISLDLERAKELTRLLGAALEDMQE